jgi:hypothetical protein
VQQCAMHTTNKSIYIVGSRLCHLQLPTKLKYPLTVMSYVIWTYMTNQEDYIWGTRTDACAAPVLVSVTWTTSLLFTQIGKLVVFDVVRICRAVARTVAAEQNNVSIFQQF